MVHHEMFWKLPGLFGVMLHRGGCSRSIKEALHTVVTSPGIANSTTEQTTVIRNKTTVIRNKTTVIRNKTTVIRNKTTVIRNKTTVIRNKTTVIRNKTTVIRNKTTVIRNKTTVIRNRSTVLRNIEQVGKQTVTRIDTWLKSIKHGAKSAYD